MIIHPAKQGTAEWLEAKAGVPSASQFHRILTPRTRKPSAAADKYLCELLAERILGHPLELATSSFMERGTSLESAAVASYEFEHEVDTQAVGFCTVDDGRYGCSPDRLVGEDGGLEVKCLSAGEHVAALLGWKDEDYLLQAQGALLVTGRKWWDILFWNPAFLPRTIRIGRDAEAQAELHDALVEFCKRLDVADLQLQQLEAGVRVKEAG